jgi:site-specific DNA-adenine methylase
MKALDFILIIKSNTKYNKKDEWSIIINHIKDNKKLAKELLESISPLLLKSNINKKDIETIIKGF